MSNAPNLADVLRLRARELARVRAEVVQQEAIEVLEFRLAEERYALETRYLVEVYPLRDLTALPGTPCFLPGVLNVRGRMLAVLDLKKFFDLPETGLTDLHRVVLVRSDDMEVGVLADIVVGVHHVPVGQVQPAPPSLGICARYLRGVTAERLIVLDVDQVLSDPKIIVHDESEAAATALT